MATRLKKLPIAVSAYDRVASWVVSLNILVGFGVSLLLLIWLSQTFEFRGEQSDVV